MKLTAGQSLQDFGVPAGAYLEVPCVLPAYVMRMAGEEWATIIPLSVNEQEELTADGLVLKSLVAFHWEDLPQVTGIFLASAPILVTDHSARGLKGLGTVNIAVRLMGGKT